MAHEKTLRESNPPEVRLLFSKILFLAIGEF